MSGVSARQRNKTGISGGDIKVLWVLSVKRSRSSCEVLNSPRSQPLTLGPLLSAGAWSLAGVKKAPHFTAPHFLVLACSSVQLALSLPLHPEKRFVSPDHICRETFWRITCKNHIFLPFHQNIYFGWEILCFVKLCFRTCNSLLWTSRKERKKKRSNSGSIRPWPCIAPLPFLYYISHTGSEAQPAVQSKLIYPEYWVPAKCLKCKMGNVGTQAGHGCWVFVWKKTRLVCMNVKSQPEHHETWLNVVEMNHVPSRLSTISTKLKQY